MSATTTTGTDAIHERIEAARKAALPEAALLKRFREYARGRQRSTLNTRHSKVLRGLLGNLFCDNVCRAVIQAPANRLQLVRFEVEAGRATADALQAYLAGWWTYTGLAALQTAVNWAFLRDGNHAVGLSWVPNKGVRLHRELWWNGETGVFVAYDEQDQPEYAVKEWPTPQGLRRTIWYPERIERYIQNGGGWRLFNKPGDPVKPSSAGQAVPWVARDGSPLGIPVVHFPNLLLPNDGEGNRNPKGEPDSRYGMGELDGGVLGLQDEINDLHRDISAAARYTGYQMLWGTGLKPPVDQETGRPVPYTVEPGAFFQDEGEGGRFGVIPAGSLAELERALNLKLRTVSRVSDTPMHLITGDWPSGVALLRAEQGLIDKVRKLAQVIGPAWGSVAHKATRLQNTFGAGPTLDEAAPIVAVFASPEASDKLTMAEYAGLIEDHISDEEYLRLLGYQPDAIGRIMQERQANRAAAVATAAEFGAGDEADDAGGEGDGDGA